MRQEINHQYSVRKIRDRYKPLFCDQNFYEINQKKFAMLATKIVADETQMPDRYEKFILSTLFLSLLRRPHDWFGGFRKKNLVPSDETPISFLSSLTFRLIVFFTSLLNKFISAI